MNEYRHHTLSVTVENKAGVLARVAGLFARRGFNIFSLEAVRNSTTTGRSSISFALSMVGWTSSGDSHRKATQPLASAHFT